MAGVGRTPPYRAVPSGFTAMLLVFISGKMVLLIRHVGTLQHLPAAAAAPGGGVGNLHRRPGVTGSLLDLVVEVVAQYDA